MGAGESTEAKPEETTQTQAQTQPQATTTPATNTTTPATLTSINPHPSSNTASTTSTAPASTTATNTNTSTATPVTPTLKPSQLQLQAQAANVSSLALAPASVQAPVTTSTPSPAAATTIATTTENAPVAAAAAAAPADAHVEFEPYVLGDQESGLWYSLVEWCAPFLPDGIVLAWDEEQVAELVQAISGSEYFRSLLVKRHQERRARLKQLKDDPNAPAPPQTQTEFEVPYDRAEQILDVDKRLGKLRKEFVPSRISEDTFWYEYFLAVIQVIKAHVIGTQQHLRTQQIQAQTQPTAAATTAAH